MGEITFKYGDLVTVRENTYIDHLNFKGKTGVVSHIENIERIGDTDIVYYAISFHGLSEWEPFVLSGYQIKKLEYNAHIEPFTIEELVDAGWVPDEYGKKKRVSD